MNHGDTETTETHGGGHSSVAKHRANQLAGQVIRSAIEVHRFYKGAALEGAFRIDVLVENLVILELKAVEELEPVHDAQLLTYLRLSNRWLGILINFNAPTIKHGIKRLVNQ